MKLTRNQIELELSYDSNEIEFNPLDLTDLEYYVFVYLEMEDEYYRGRDEYYRGRGE